MEIDGKTFNIIDFHTHPFKREEENICSHKDYLKTDMQHIKSTFSKLGIEKICGSVIGAFDKTDVWGSIERLNNSAISLYLYYEGFYVPGFHIHPKFVKESIKEIERMSKLNVNLVGELVPYMQEWGDIGYNDKGFYQILEAVEHYNMVLSIHSMGEDQMDELVRSHKNLKIVGAHPGEYNEFMRHLKRMEYSDNYFLDLSGYGIFRYGMLRHAIDEFGAERFLFGSDYPTCNPAMYVGGVVLDDTITDEEKEKILFFNAKNLLGIK